MKRSSLNSKEITEAYHNPTPENKHLRDQYQYSYPTHNKLRIQGERLPERVKEIHGDSLSLYHHQYYQGYEVPLRWYCHCCGHSWEQTPRLVVTGKLGCPECAKKKPRKKLVRASQEEIDKVIALHQAGNSIKKLSEMTGRAPGTINRWVNPEVQERSNAYFRDRYHSSKY